MFLLIIGSFVTKDPIFVAMRTTISKLSHGGINPNPIYRGLSRIYDNLISTQTPEYLVNRRSNSCPKIDLTSDENSHWDLQENR